jgi:hypothetical protein
LFRQTDRRRSAFDMLKAISETLDRLRAELPPPITRTATNYDSLTEDQLIEQLEVMLKSCYERRDSKLK